MNYLVILRNGFQFKVDESRFQEFKKALIATAEHEYPIDLVHANWNDMLVRLSDVSAIISQDNTL